MQWIPSLEEVRCSTRDESLTPGQSDEQKASVTDKDPPGPMSEVNNFQTQTVEDIQNGESYENQTINKSDNHEVATEHVVQGVQDEPVQEETNNRYVLPPMSNKRNSSKTILSRKANAVF